METQQILNLATNALEDKKAQNITILDVRKCSSITDFMIVATGRTARQVSALSQHVIAEMKSNGERPLGDEGIKQGEWALVDIGDVIVHIMQPETREFYQLEKLWGELGDKSAQLETQNT
ncbi:MAG: ribosome silencing factor [Thiomargarita sp.]|nr:ribosome silencing factor [Thiomargarita sp.]